MAEEQTIDNKNVIERDTETPKAQKIPEKRKASSPIAPPSKVLVVSSSSFEALNHTVVDEKDVQIPRKTTDCQNVTLISSLTRSEISGLCPVIIWWRDFLDIQLYVIPDILIIQYYIYTSYVMSNYLL